MDLDVFKSTKDVFYNLYDFIVFKISDTIVTYLYKYFDSQYILSNLDKDYYNVIGLLDFSIKLIRLEDLIQMHAIKTELPLYFDRYSNIKYLTRKEVINFATKYKKNIIVEIEKKIKFS